MMADRYRSIVDVHVILHQAGQILLLERRATGFADGQLHLPSGHLEEGEPLHVGAAREAREEVGVAIDPDHLTLAAVVHHRQSPELARLGMFFVATQWLGEAYVSEPHKAGKLQWVDRALLPSTTIDYSAAGIRAWLNSAGYVPHGW